MPTIAHKSYRSRVVRSDIPLIQWYWSVVDHHFVDDDLQLLRNFDEFPRNRQQLSLDVLRSHVPRSHSVTFHDHVMTFSFNSVTSLHLLGSRLIFNRSCHVTNSGLDTTWVTFKTEDLTVSSVILTSVTDSSCSISIYVPSSAWRPSVRVSIVLSVSVEIYRINFVSVVLWTNIFRSCRDLMREPDECCAIQISPSESRSPSINRSRFPVVSMCVLFMFSLA